MDFALNFLAKLSPFPSWYAGRLEGTMQWFGEDALTVFVRYILPILSCFQYQSPSSSASGCGASAAAGTSPPTAATGDFEDDEVEVGVVEDELLLPLRICSCNLLTCSSAADLASSRSRHVLWTSCLAFLDNFRHSLPGIDGGLNVLCRGLLKILLPW